MEIVKRLVSQRWGSVEDIEEIHEGVWEVETKFKSGLVVDFEQVILPVDISLEFWKVVYNDGGINDEEQHFAMFDSEDRAVLGYYYPELSDGNPDKILEERPELA